MTRKLPEELAPAMAKIGLAWPQADEDGLRSAAGVWRDFGTEAERLSRRGGDSAQRVTSDNSGRAVDAFAEHWQGFTGSGRGHLDDAQSAAEHIAGAFDKAAGAAEHCKGELVSALTELAAEMKKADDAKAQAEQAKTAAAAAAPAAGVVGAVVGAVQTAVHDAAAAAADLALAAAVEAAKLKIGGLLEELGREMKDALKAALDEPALTALDRLAGGGSGTVLASAGAVGGVAAVRVVMGKNGKLKVVGPDGEKIPASEGLHATIVDGQAVVLDKAGNPVTGLATGTDGQLLTDAQGKPLLVGTDGTVENRKGQPVLVGTDGSLLKLGPDGGLLTVDANGVTIGPQGDPLLDLHHHHGHDGGETLSVDAAGATVTAQAGPSGLDAQVASAPQNSDGQGGDNGWNGNGNGHGYGHHHRGWDNGYGNSNYGGDSGYGNSNYGGGDGYRGSNDGYRQPSGGNGYDSPPPVNFRHGPVSVQTDSVAIAPPNVPDLDPAAPGLDPIYGGSALHSGGGGVGEPGFSGGSAAIGGGVSDGFQQPTFGGAPGAGSAPIGGVPAGAAPVPPLGGAAPGIPATPGTPMSGSPMSGGSAAGGSGGVGMVGAPGAVGVGGGHSSVGGSTLSRPPAAPGAIAQPGGAGAQTAPIPLRVVQDPYLGIRPRDAVTTGGGSRPDGSPELGLIPGGLLAAHLINRALGRPGLTPGVDLALPRTSADGRPYGLPGGLGPVDPAHQAELVRRVPVNEDGYILPFPDPRAGDWAEALNGGGARETGRHNNGVDISLSGMDTFAGRPTCSAPRLPDGPAGERGGRDRAERELGTHFLDLGDGPAAHERLARALLAVGPGAQAVLCTLDEFGRSHSWNAVNHEGVLTYLDHQTARQAAEPLYPADHGLWAIAVDAECRPVDLADTQLLASAAKPVPQPLPTAAAPAAAAEPLASAVTESAAAVESVEAVESAGEAAEEGTVPPRSRLTAHRAPAGKGSAH